MEAAGGGGGAAWRGQAEDRNTGDNPDDCPVCLTAFDDKVQRPRSLPCGHTVCTLCMDKLKKQDRVTCPECRVRHAVPKTGQFPICYTLEAVIKMLRSVKLAAATSASPPPSADKGKGAARIAGKKIAAGLSKKMISFLQEQEAKVVAAITTCRETQAQLDQYQATLTGWGEQQQQLEGRLQGLMDQSKSARELVQQEKSRASAKGEEMKKEEQELQVILETLRGLTTEQEVGMVVTEVVRCTGRAEQVVEEYRESFPDANTVTTVTKVREAMSAALETAQVTLETLHTITTAELWPQTEPDSTDRLQLILTPSLNAEDIHNLTQRASRLLQAGRVFAVHQVEGQRRNARISLDAGRPCLHALGEHPLPRGAATLQAGMARAGRDQ